MAKPMGFDTSPSGFDHFAKEYYHFCENFAKHVATEADWWGMMIFLDPWQIMSGPFWVDYQWSLIIIGWL